MKRFEGQVVLVTGGGKGIGEAAVRLFAEEGARVVIADMDEEAGHLIEKDVPQSLFVKTDVAVEEDVAAVVDATVEEFGTADGMIKNAGFIGATGPIDTLPSEGWRRTIDVLLHGPFYGIRHAARVMGPRGCGRVLCTASTASLASGLGAHAYTTAKHGLVGLVKSAAADLAPMGITVNAVAPGSTVTPLAVQYYGDLQAAIAAVAAESPIGEAILPKDIAEAFAFLASPAAAKVTGQILAVDGGVLAVGNGSARRFYAR